MEDTAEKPERMQLGEVELQKQQDTKLAECCVEDEPKTKAEELGQEGLLAVELLELKQMLCQQQLEQERQLVLQKEREELEKQALFEQQLEQEEAELRELVLQQRQEMEAAERRLFQQNLAQEEAELQQLLMQQAEVDKEKACQAKLRQEEVELRELLWQQQVEEGEPKPEQEDSD